MTQTTLSELKSIIKEVVREVVREELTKSKINDYPTYIPVPPCYKYYDYRDYQITCTDRTIS